MAIAARGRSSTAAQVPGGAQAVPDGSAAAVAALRRLRRAVEATTRSASARRRRRPRAGRRSACCGCSPGLGGRASPDWSPTPSRGDGRRPASRARSAPRSGARRPSRWPYEHARVVVAGARRSAEHDGEDRRLRADLTKARDAIDELHRLELIDARPRCAMRRDRERGRARRSSTAPSRGSRAVLPPGSRPSGPRPPFADRPATAARASPSWPGWRRRPRPRRPAGGARPTRPAQGPADGAPAAGVAASRRRAWRFRGGDRVPVRSAASVFIDGYNVAKLGWPELDLERPARSCCSMRSRTSPGALAPTSRSCSTVPARRRTADRRRWSAWCSRPPA